MQSQESYEALTGSDIEDKQALIIRIQIRILLPLQLPNVFLKK